MIKDDKTRTLLTINKELKSNLENIAKKDCRSFNSLIVKILTDYIESQK